MASVIFEDDVSGLGSSVMGGTRVLYVAWEVTIQGPGVHRPSVWDANMLLGVGHFEFGNDLTPGGLISGIGWDVPHWLYTAIGQWIAPPGAVGASFSEAIAQYIRWSMSPGTTAHIVVFGD